MSSEEVANTQINTEEGVESESVTIDEEVQEEINTDEKLPKKEEVESFELAENESSVKDDDPVEKNIQNVQDIEGGDTAVIEEDAKVEQVETSEQQAENLENVKQTEGIVEEIEKGVNEAVPVSEEKKNETVTTSEEQNEGAVTVSEEKKEEVTDSEKKEEITALEVKEEAEKKEDVEKVEDAVDDTIKKKTSDTDLKSILGNEEKEGSFTLLQEDEVEQKVEEPEPKENKEEDLLALLGLLKKKQKKKKKKKKKPKQEILYDLESDATTYNLKITDSDSVMRIGGDFVAVGDLAKSPMLGMLLEGGDDEDEEEEEEEEEEQEVNFLDKQQRQGYIDFYASLEKEFREEKAKNLYLQGQLVNHYHKKKMFSVINETKISLDKVKRYEKQLDDFQQSVEKIDKQKITADAEITALKARRLIRISEIESSVKQFHSELYEVAKEFINLPSAKGHEEKVVERYLKRYKIQISNLAKIRLDYIKYRNKVNEVQDRLKAIDNLGSHLRLMDYEQLKLDNRNLRDKFEGRDLELLRIRTKCQNAVQILAHRREKVAAIDTDIENLKKRLELIEYDYEDVRKHLREAKCERDQYRKTMFKLKKEAGMLGKPTLINDFCRTMEERKVLKQELETLKKNYHSTCEKVVKIRRNLGSKSKMKVIKLMMRSSFSKTAAYEIPSAITSTVSGITSTTHASTATIPLREPELESISQA